MGSRPVQGEGVRSAHESPLPHRGWRSSGEMLSVDSNYAGSFTNIVGCPNGGWRCLGEVGPGPGRHYAGWRSLLAERRWLRGRKPVVVGESWVALEVSFPITSGIVPWKAKNWMVGHPLIGLDR